MRGIWWIAAAGVAWLFMKSRADAAPAGGAQQLTQAQYDSLSRIEQSGQTIDPDLLNDLVAMGALPADTIEAYFDPGLDPGAVLQLAAGVYAIGPDDGNGAGTTVGTTVASQPPRYRQVIPNTNRWYDTVEQRELTIFQVPSLEERQKWFDWMAASQEAI